jgi:hypothetical protein
MRFKLRTLFVLVAVLASWLGWQADWIRQRHEMLADQAALDIKLKGDSFEEVDTANLFVCSFPTPWTSAHAVLWLFREPEVSVMRLRVIVDDVRPWLNLDHEEIKRTHRLFPEAEIRWDGCSIPSAGQGLP